MSDERYVLVPVVATDAMLEAGDDVDAGPVWSAMLSAAPPPDDAVIERVARAIAKANGDEFANAFTNKSRWIAKRGMSGGRYRDVNEPFQHDYIDMAAAAIAALCGGRVDG